MTASFERRPHVPLVLLLLGAIALFPAIEDYRVARLGLNALIVLGTVVTLHRVRARRAYALVVAAFGLLALVAQAAHEMRDAGGAGLAGLLSSASEFVFLGGAAGLMVAYMMQDARATVDELFAAAAALLLLAMAWAGLYWCIAFLDPGAFNISHADQHARSTMFDFLYLSMTTITTTGYGDVLPISSWARSAVMLEQFVGVLYVALVISRLAGFAGQERDLD